MWRVELALEPEDHLGVPEFLRELEEEVTVEDSDGHDRFLVLTRAAGERRRALLHTGWTNETVRR